MPSDSRNSKATGLFFKFHCQIWLPHLQTSPLFPGNLYLIQNSPAVKKVCGPKKGHCEKRCKI